MKKYLKEYGKGTAKILGALGLAGLLAWLAPFLPAFRRWESHFAWSDAQISLAQNAGLFVAIVAGWMAGWIFVFRLPRKSGDSSYPDSDKQALAVLGVFYCKPLGCSDEDVRQIIRIPRDDLLFHLQELSRLSLINLSLRGVLGGASGWYEITQEGRQYLISRRPGAAPAPVRSRPNRAVQ